MEALAVPSTGALPRPRLLALDIDGTILDARGGLRRDVQLAVALVADTGVRVVLATGRSPWGGVGPIAEALGIAGLHVTMQGALVSNPGTDVVARVRTLAAPVYEEALRFAAALGLDPVVGLLQGHRAERLAEGVDFLAAHRVELRSFRHVPDLGALAGAPPIRVFLPTGPERHRAVRTAAAEAFAGRAAIIWSDRSGIEILPPGTDKGEALAWLATSHGIGLDEVAAVGDAPNDIGMLRVAGRSAAMGAAPADVRAVADIVVPTSDDAGVLDALAWFFPDLERALTHTHRRVPNVLAVG